MLTDTGIDFGRVVGVNDHDNLKRKFLEPLDKPGVDPFRQDNGYPCMYAQAFDMREFGQLIGKGP